MPVLRCASRGRLAMCALLALVCGLVSGCKGEGEKPTEGKEMAGGPAALEAFAPPKLSASDLAGLPMALEMKITSAYYEVVNSPNDPRKLSDLAALYFAHDFPAAAAECFERMMRLQPGAEAWLYFLALAFERAGRTAPAVAAFGKLITLPKGATYEAAHVRLADLVLAEDSARAAQLYRRAAELNPASARAHFGVGRAAAAEGQQDEALRHLGQALAYAPRYADAHRAAAEVLRAAGRTAEADSHLRQAQVGDEPPPLDDPLALSVQRGGLDPEVLCNDALFLAHQGKFKEAEELIRQASQMGAAGTSSDAALGTVLALQGRWSESAAKFRQVLAADPEAVAVRSGLGQVLAELGQVEEAERLLRGVLAERPDDAVTLQRFDTLMKKLGKPEEAARLMQEAVEADPFNATLHVLLAPLLSRGGQDEEAGAHLRKAVELHPGLFAARHALAGWLREQGDSAGAEAQWREVLKINPRFWEAYAALAVVAIEGEDRSAAKEVLREGLSEVPNAHVLAEKLARILATSSDAKQRNGPEAVEWAEKACAATHNQNHGYLDTLAAAYAEAGRFEDALRAGRQAVELAVAGGAAESAEGYRTRVGLYEQGKAYHESE